MSKDLIIKNIVANKPDKISLPGPMSFPANDHDDLIDQFTDSLISAGAEVVELERADHVEEWIRQQKENVKTVFDLTKKLDDQAKQTLTSHDFIDSDVVVLRGQMGVAENGAVWVEEKDMQIRLLPFIAGHLVIVVQKEDILSDMHQAYDQIDLTQTGFGLFIAGPSKTADIEQSLVIGAHGPVRHTVLLVEGII